MAFSAWLAAETPLGLWENGRGAACGPPERFTTSSARVGWDRKMWDNLQKAKTLEYQVAYGDALLVEFLCYEAFSVPGMASCWMTPMAARLASKRRLTTDCTQ